VRDADGSTVLHHIARAKQDVEPMFRELKKHQQPALDVLLDAADGNGDTPLLVVCDGKCARPLRSGEIAVRESFMIVVWHGKLSSVINLRLFTTDH
jgi:hypothetical protein